MSVAILRCGRPLPYPLMKTPNRGMQAGGDTIASEVWAIGGSDCDMIGEADEDGDLFLEDDSTLLHY